MIIIFVSIIDRIKLGAAIMESTDNFLMLKKFSFHNEIVSFDYREDNAIKNMNNKKTKDGVIFILFI